MPDRDWPGDARRTAELVAQLSDRDREVLFYLADGYAIREIADDLWLSPRTVESHRSRIALTLGVRRRFELAAAVRAWREGGGASVPALRRASASGAAEGGR